MNAPGFVVEVVDSVNAGLGASIGSTYTSPVMAEHHARAMARMFLGGPGDPDGSGPWRRPIAGGRRIVRLEPTFAPQPIGDANRNTGA